jgi:hypothetical protein
MDDEDYPGLEAENDGHQDHACLRCGQPLKGYRADAKWCSDACRKRFTRREARLDRQRQKYLSGHPDVSLDDVLLTMDPDTWRRPGHDDDQDHGDQDDDQGPGNSWSGMWRVHEAAEVVRASYERQMAPYRRTQARNPGVKLPGLVALERERDDEISRMVRAHDHADEAGRAKRYEPRRINEARERQRERVALQALGNALPGNRYQRPAYTGRATHDLWRW